jgi:hypothetical protein
VSSGLVDRFELGDIISLFAFFFIFFSLQISVFITAIEVVHTPTPSLVLLSYGGLMFHSDSSFIFRKKATIPMDLDPLKLQYMVLGSA